MRYQYLLSLLKPNVKNIDEKYTTTYTEKLPNTKSLSDVSIKETNTSLLNSDVIINDDVELLINIKSVDIDKKY